MTKKRSTVEVSEAKLRELLGAAEEAERFLPEDHKYESESRRLRLSIEDVKDELEAVR